MEVFPSHRERWRIQKVVGALEMYPTQTIRGMAQLIGMSKTRVYETLRDAFSKLEDYGYDWITIVAKDVNKRYWVMVCSFWIAYLNSSTLKHKGKLNTLNFFKDVWICAYMRNSSDSIS